MGGSTFPSWMVGGLRLIRLTSGWALGDGQEHGDDPNWDAHEANALYDCLEREVIPAFYHRDGRGIPTIWTTKVRSSMLRLTPQFSSNRAVREYVEKFYLPAAGRYRERTANESKLGIELASRMESLAELWSDLRFGDATMRTDGTQYAFEVQIFFGRLDPRLVEVELYAEPQADGKIFRQRMQPTQTSDSNGYAVYSCKVPASRPVADYTPRIIPGERHASVPLEANQILWQK